MCTHVDRCHHQARRRAVLIASMLFSSLMLAWAFAAECGDRQQGQRLYRHYCAVCHGMEGTGAGRNAPSLEQMGRAPRDHTDAWYMNRLSDAELYRAISQGKRREGEPPFMPWWGYTLTEQDIWDLVAFIRGLAREPAE
jgi:mono/diheme cytochrome c family protein